MGKRARFSPPELWNLLELNSSVQDGIYALRKAHTRSTPSLRHFPNVAFEISLSEGIDWIQSAVGMLGLV